MTQTDLSASLWLLHIHMTKRTNRIGDLTIPIGENHQCTCVHLRQVGQESHGTHQKRIKSYLRRAFDERVFDLHPVC